MPKDNDNINYSKEGQAEFFSEFQASGENKFAYFKKEMSLGRKMVLSVSYENLALVFIVLIMLVVIFFSLGVERGKRIVIKNMRTRMATPADSDVKKVSVGNNSAVANQIPVAAGKKPSTDDYAGQTAGKPYTIQVMAVKKIEEARKETARLNSMGYKAFIVRSSTWYHVCIGRYAGTAELTNDLAAIKEEYPNCYVRKMKE